MPSIPTLEGFQRVGFLAVLPRVLRDFGVDPLEVLTAAGVESSALDNPENAIPYTKMGLLAEIAAEKTARPHLGLEIGKHINISTLGIVGELMRTAPTLRIALQDFATHHHRNAHGGAVYLLEVGEETFFGYAVYQIDMPGHSLISDGAALAAYNFVRELLGVENLGSMRVLLSRPEPKSLNPYLKAFGIKPCFNAGQSAITLPRNLLNQPLPRSNTALRKQIAASISTLHARHPDTLTQLRRELRVGLIKGDISAVKVSSRMGIGRRTLQRRLSSLDCSFQGVLDEVRCEFAKQLLANTLLSIEQIGTILGYADPSVLTRGFSRWTGMSPTRWRTDLTVQSSERITLSTSGNHELRVNDEQIGSIGAKQ